jgi:DNA-binding beta-propeller fold protein YncE
VLVAAGFGGAYLALHRTGSHTLAVPPCGNGTAAGADLHGVHTNFSLLPGGIGAFGIAAAKDGRFVFTVTRTSVTVMTVGSGLALTQKSSYPLAGTTASQGAAGMALDGPYLLVAIGSGIDVLSVAGLEGNGTASRGTLTVPGLTGYGKGVQVAATPDGHYAFVALQASNEVAMFDLRKAAATNFTQSGYVGVLDVGAQPVGLSVSADGRWLYTTDHGTGSGHGTLSVINIAKTVRLRRAVVVARVPGLCWPARIALSAGTIWVTTQMSNYLLGFSAALLLAQPHRALIAKIEVGQNPVGVAVVNNGSRIVVADANDLKAGSANLAVIDVARALARKPALLGYIRSRKGAREFAVSRSGTDLYISDLNPAEVETVDLASLP